MKANYSMFDDGAGCFFCHYFTVPYTFSLQENSSIAFHTNNE